MNSAAHDHIPAIHGEAVSLLGLISDTEIARLYGHNPFTILRRRLRLGIPTFQQWEKGTLSVRLPALVRGTISAFAGQRRRDRQAQLTTH